MANDISIKITAKDNFTSAISTMRSANQSFNKDLSGTQQKLAELNKTKIQLKVETSIAKAALNDAEKQFKRTGSAATEMAMQMANADYEQAKRNLGLVSTNAKQAEKDILSMTGAVSKAENRASIKEGISKDLNPLLIAGGLKIGGDLLANGANVLGQSAFGSDGGNIFSNLLSGAGTGAALGQMYGVQGAAIGGIVGGLAGATSGVLQNYGKEDEAFKSARVEMITGAQQRTAGDITAGTTIASGRELDAIAFTKLMGSEQVSSEYLDWVKDTANSTPLIYDDLKTMSKTLATYGFNAEKMQEKLIQIGDTGSALGMDAGGMSAVATYLGRMKSTNKTTMEYINPLTERGIDAMGYLAESLNVSKAQVGKMISGGQISGEYAADVISKGMGNEYAGSMKEMSVTFAGLASTLEGLETEMQVSYGEGYINERKKGMQQQIAYLGGDGDGDGQTSPEEKAEHEQRLKSNELIGAFEADLENQREELLRKHEAQAYEIIEAEKYDGAQAGKLLAQARVEAQAEYNSSEGAKLQAQSERELVGSVTEMLSEDKTYWNSGYLMGIEQSKGRMAAYKELLTIPMETNSQASDVGFVMSRGKGYAYGLQNVPYNNFPAMLHQGERVLTAAQARSYGGSAQVTVTGNEFIIRQDGDIDLVAQKIVERIRLAEEVRG